MEEEKPKKDQTKHVETASIVGPLWYIGWLFTLGLVKFGFWKALLALIIWPYYLGNSLAG